MLMELGNAASPSLQHPSHLGQLCSKVTEITGSRAEIEKRAMDQPMEIRSLLESELSKNQTWKAYTEFLKTPMGTAVSSLSSGTEQQREPRTINRSKLET